jgi:hypothetical protein
MFKNANISCHLFEGVKFQNKAPKLGLNGKENINYQSMLKDLDFINNNLSLIDLDFKSKSKIDQKLDDLLLPFKNMKKVKKIPNNKNSSEPLIMSRSTQKNENDVKIIKINKNKSAFFPEKLDNELIKLEPLLEKSKYSVPNLKKPIIKNFKPPLLESLSSIQTSSKLINTPEQKSRVMESKFLPVKQQSKYKDFSTISTKKELNETKEWYNFGTPERRKEDYMKIQNMSTIINPTLTLDKKNVDEFNNTIKIIANSIVSEDIVEGYEKQLKKNKNMRKFIKSQELKNINKLSSNDIIDGEEKKKMIDKVKNLNFYGASLTKIRKEPYSFYKTFCEDDKFLKYMDKIMKLSYENSDHSLNLMKEHLEKVYNYQFPKDYDAYVFLDNFQKEMFKTKMNRTFHKPKDQPIKIRLNSFDSKLLLNQQTLSEKFNNTKSSFSNTRSSSHKDGKKVIYQLCNLQLENSKQIISNHKKAKNVFESFLDHSLKKCFYKYVNGNLEKDVVNFFKNKRGKFVNLQQKGYYLDNEGRIFNSAADSSKRNVSEMKFMNNPK